MSAISFSQKSGKTYILVHGAFHDAWCWYRVVPLLEIKGYKVVAIYLPGHGKDTANAANIGLADYVQKVVTVANEQAGQVILVGHSMAGVVISQAAEALGTGKVASLVYLDAFLPATGESVFSLAAAVKKQLPPSSVHSISMRDCMIISEDRKTALFNTAMAQQFFYDDCTADDISLAKANLCVQSLAPLGTPVVLTDTIYGRVPKYYILCTKSKDLDKTFLSTHVPCKKYYTLPSSHSPYFSMPQKLVEILAAVY